MGRALSKIYLIPNIEQIGYAEQLAKKYNVCFEYNDFFSPEVFNKEEEIERRMAVYMGLDRDRSRDTLHGAFLDVTIHSQDEEIKKVSEKRIRQSLTIAQRMGVGTVIFHSNLIAGFYAKPYLDNWLEKSTVFWNRMLDEFPDLQIYVENMFERRCDELLQLAEKMKDRERFGICLDYAHAMAFGKETDGWIEKLAPYIRHMHINDNDLCEDLHLALGEGRIDWQRWSADIKKQELGSSVLIEVRELEQWEKSIRYLQEKQLF